MPSDECFETALHSFGPKTALRQGLLLTCPLCEDCTTLSFEYNGAIGNVGAHGPAITVATVNITAKNGEKLQFLASVEDLQSLRSAIDLAIREMDS